MSLKGIVFCIEKARAQIKHEFFDYADKSLREAIDLVRLQEDIEYIRNKPMRASWLYNDFGLDPLGGIIHKEGR